MRNPQTPFAALSRFGLKLLAVLALVSPVLMHSQPAQAAEAVPASQLVNLLSVSDETAPTAYVRARFEHWIDADGNGCNARYEVLIASSLTMPTINSGCKLEGGSWILAYSGQSATSPTEIEIDHVVALAEAWRSGAWAWTDASRREFANDLGAPYALVPTDTASNQAKADNDPARWLPQSGDVCNYVIDWARVKLRWGLTVDSLEHQAIATQLSDECGQREIELPEIRAVEIEQSSGDGSGTLPAPGATVIEPLPSGTTRLAGPGRYETAIATSTRYAPGVPAVYVANGTNFPDALGAAAAAAKVGAPLLLTPADTLLASVASEIARLAPAKIVVAGGTGSVSAAVETQLAGIAPVDRFGGQDRYETGLRIVQAAFPSSSFAVIATGRGFADALAATGVAGKQQAPVILVDGTAPALSGTTLAELSRLGVTSVLVAGGTGSVSSGIEQQLWLSGIQVNRQGGADRYSTAAMINTAYFPAGSSDLMLLANGQNFPDALAGAALGGTLAAPLFITQADCVPVPVHDAIGSLNASKRVVLGGTGSVSDYAAALGKCAPPLSGNNGGTPGTDGPPPGARIVNPGAYCKKVEVGHIGYTVTGVRMVCAYASGESIPRWRQA